MRNTILMTLLAVLSALQASAQFHTVAKGEENKPLFMMERPVLVQKRPDKEERSDKSPVLFLAGMVKSPEQLLQGKVAGLQLSNYTGDPVLGLEMTIRGVNSLSEIGRASCRERV